MEPNHGLRAGIRGRVIERKQDVCQTHSFSNNYGMGKFYQ
jgi:hypothetical protein